MRDLVVIGLGPAGSAFTISYLENTREFSSIKIYDSDREYGKPCGEVVPNIDFDNYIIEPTVIKEIKDFTVKANGQVLSHRSYNKPLWFVIDKKEWIASHRRLIERLGVRITYERIGFSNSYLEGEKLVIDARGPYSVNRLRKIPIARGFIEVKEPIDEVILDFDTVNIGFYWVFPSRKNLLNVGYGSIQVKDPRKILVEKTKKYLNDSRIVRVDASVITIDKPLDNYYCNNALHVGESAGFVYPLTGEGIRPSYAHGEAMGRLLAEEKDPIITSRLVKSNDSIKETEKDIRFQAFLMDVIFKMNTRDRRRVFNCLHESSIDNLLREDLGFTDLLMAGVKCPWLLKYVL